MDISRRNLLKSLAALLVAQSSAPTRDFRSAVSPPLPMDRRSSCWACGGIRRAENLFGNRLRQYPTSLSRALPQSTFFPLIRNNGVTSHYNTTSSLITGNWQRIDDWGKTRPQSPTIFEYARKQMRLPQDQTWLISSNKALTSQIGSQFASGLWRAVWRECAVSQTIADQRSGQRRFSRPRGP